MEKFRFVAKNKRGIKSKGMIEARDKATAIKMLHDRNLLVIELKKQKERKSLLEYLGIRRKVSGTEVTNFTRQLATMITAGLPINDALDILRLQSSAQLAKVIEYIIRDVEAGMSLADAFTKFKNLFGEVYIALIRAGESAGALDKILEQLAVNLEKQREFRGKTKGALVYPAIVVIAMIGVGFIMMVFVVPKMTDLYKDFEADLPMATQLLISFSEFLTKFWWLIIGLAGGVVYGLSAYRKTIEGRRMIDRLMFRLPVYGNLKKEIILTEYTRTLSLLLSSGIPIIDAINIVAETSDNVVYKESMKEIAKEVEKGRSMAMAIAQDDVYPPIFGQMVSVGEQTGKVDEVLRKLSKYFELESEQLVRGLTTAIEPLIMIVLGVGVAFLIIAIIMPIYNLTSQF